MPEPEKSAVHSREEKDRQLRELRLRRVQLEQQNEELRLGRVEIEAGLQKYFDLYDFAPVGYCTVDCKGNIRESNLAGALLLGVDRSRLLARNIGDFVTEVSRSWLALFFERAFSAEKKATGEIRVPDGEGGERHLYLEGSSFEAASGEQSAG